MEKRTPSWMIALVACFGTALAAFIVMYLTFHAQRVVAQDEARRLTAEIPDLREKEEALKAQVEEIDRMIEEARQVLGNQVRVNTDEMDAVQAEYVPRLRDTRALVEEELEKIRQKRERLLTDTKGVREDLAVEESEAFGKRARNEEDIEALRSRIRERAAELEKMKEGNRRQIRELQGEISLREARVKELLDRREVKDESLISDGQVLQVLPQEGFVILNRGINHDLRTGTRFTIYNLLLGGKAMVKGEIAVVEVEPSVAIARIVSEVDRNNPIIPGDHIHNPVYSPDDVKIFVVKGDFDLYSREELRHFIRLTGNEVQDQISSKTDFLVAGANSTKAVEQAADNGVTILSERQLVEFIRRDRRSIDTQGLSFVVVGQFSDLSKGDINGYIEENGGTQEDSINKNTRVVIAGAGAEDAMQRAREIGALVVTEAELIDILQRETEAEESAEAQEKGAK
jgi:NAD-dependent DNA ligase